MNKTTTKKLLSAFVLGCFLLLPMVSGGLLAGPITNQIFDLPVSKSITGQAADDLANKIFQLDEYKVISAKYNTNEKRLSVKQYNQLYDNTYAVGIPIIDNTDFNFSYFIAFFDSKSEFIGTHLIVYDKMIDGNYHFTSITDQMQMEIDISEEGKIINGNILYADGHSDDINAIMSSEDAEDFWPCLNSCFGNLGIPNWAIVAIGAACTTACAISLGTGCFVCIAALDFTVGFDIGYCLSYCWELSIKVLA